MTKLSVVVPCYNEEAVIDSFDAEIRRVLDALPVEYEVCYVDDGSRDGTLGKLRKIAATYGEQTRYVSFSRNFGKEAGMLAGLGAAGFGWLALDHGHSFSVIGAGLVVGAAVSFGYAAMPAVIMASVPHHQSGIANGINSISRSTGSAIGSAIVTTILASKTIEHLPPGVPALPAESGFTLTFGIGAAAFALVALISWLGLRSGHGPRVAAASADVPATAKAAATDAAQDGAKAPAPVADTADAV